MSTYGQSRESVTRYKSIRMYKKESWFRHCSFGVGVSIRLMCTSVLLLINSLLPCIPIPKMFRIHDTSHWLGLKSWTRKQDRMKYMRGL